MICSDIIGHFQAFTPKFVKRYDDVAGEISRSFEQYIAEVHGGEFPTSDYAYSMIEGEMEKLESMLDD